MMRRIRFLAVITIVVLGWSAAGAGEFAKHDAVTTVTGKLVTADFIHRTGQFRRDESGELVDFVMAPYASIKYFDVEADLRDVPLETSFDFLLAHQVRGGRGVLAAMHERRTADTLDPKATEAQRERHAAFVKFRGLPGWIDRTQGNELTITLFSGEPKRFEQAWMGDFAVGKGVDVVVANDELRTWNPGVDREKATLREIQRVPTDGYGTSGVRLVVTVPNMLEGFRQGRVVRCFASGWPLKDQFYGESLMNYGYTPLRTPDLIECVAKDYPEQLPFRTDYGNEQLPWYKLRSDEAPPPFSEHLVFGDLVSVDAEGRTGRFRTDRTGELVDFTLIPTGIVKYLGAEASLADLPLGMRCRFQLYQDEQGAFTRASLISDEFSHLVLNLMTLRIDALRLDEGKVYVARQIPEVKNYSADVETVPDLGQQVLLVSDATRLWKGAAQAKLADLAVGDALLVNLTGEQLGCPSRAADLWVGAESQKAATDGQLKKHPAAKPTKK
ncbi:MAG TPA: hypothetical protein VHZ24_00620 [Pirellulales bacterium]|jgi:hypothetical protein|nr:hypothetical protein [Pirellulales bacterium]